MLAKHVNSNHRAASQQKNGKQYNDVYLFIGQFLMSDDENEDDDDDDDVEKCIKIDK